MNMLMRNITLYEYVNEEYHIYEYANESCHIYEYADEEIIYM